MPLSRSLFAGWTLAGSLALAPAVQAAFDFIDSGSPSNQEVVPGVARIGGSGLSEGAVETPVWAALRAVGATILSRAAFAVRWAALEPWP